MALTLLEASKIRTGNVVRDSVIQMFAASSDLLAAIPFMNINGSSYAYNQEGRLPGVAFRGINEGYSQSSGILNPQVESLRISGGELDVDRALVKMHGPEIRSIHERMKIKALSLYMAKTFIKGNSLVDPREFDGLQNRIGGSQLISNSAVDGGGPLSFLKLDEMIDSVDDITHLIMSKAMRRLIGSAARTDVFRTETVVDQLTGVAREVTHYRGHRILIADYDDLGDRILDFDEVGAGGSTATAASIYGVSFGDGMLTGLQNGEMTVEDLGELPNLPVYRMRIEWYTGLAALHGRCAARLYGVSNATPVA